MLKQRVITAVILAPIAIACIFFLPKTGFIYFVGAVITVSAWEWANLAGLTGWQRYLYAAFVALCLLPAIHIPLSLVLSAAALWWLAALFLVVQYPKRTSLWGGQWTRCLIGLLSLIPGFVALVELKSYADSSFLILMLFFLIWGADIGAYFTGKAIGKHKLAPDVSPGKSLEGLFGGVVVALIIAVLMLQWLGRPSLDFVDSALFMLGCLGIILISVLGDLALSMFKRFRGVKDSSALLPGHGGFLDRLDSLLSAAPLFVLFLVVFQW